MTLTKELRDLLNRHGAENPSGTPDFILARFLMECLTAWNNGVIMREKFYGRSAQAELNTFDAEAEAQAAAALREGRL